MACSSNISHFASGSLNKPYDASIIGTLYYFKPTR